MTTEQELPEDEPEIVKVESVALYHVDRAYGGPEEGGWWFDCGELVDLDEAVRLAPDYWKPQFILSNADEVARKKLRKYVELGNQWLDENPNEGLPEISSVLSQGRYQLCWCDGIPHSWPKVRPHWE